MALCRWFAMLLQHGNQCCVAWFCGWGPQCSRCRCGLWIGDSDTGAGRHHKSLPLHAPSFKFNQFVWSSIVFRDNSVALKSNRNKKLYFITKARAPNSRWTENVPFLFVQTTIVLMYYCTKYYAMQLSTSLLLQVVCGYVFVTNVNNKLCNVHIW